jgi:hypothetical protein
MFLREVAEGFAQIAKGVPAFEESLDDLGKPVRLARFARFGVLVPA